MMRSLSDSSPLADPHLLTKRQLSFSMVVFDADEINQQERSSVG
jgi:hypothetical protein